MLSQDHLDYIRSVRLIDDHFMMEVFKDRSCLQLLLDILVHRHISIKKAETSYRFHQIMGHGGVFDIFIEDEKGNFYDIEVQRSSHDSLIKRARYYLALMDIEKLKKGKKYEELKESYTIWISEEDFFKAGKNIYHIERKVEELNGSVKEGTHMIIVNAKKQDESEIGKLMNDFYCTKAKDMNYEVLAKRVRYLKETKEGRKKMEGIEEKIRQEGVRKGKREGKKEGLLEGMILILMKMLRNQIGEITKETEKKIRESNEQQLDALTLEIRHIQKEEDILSILRQTSS